VNRRVWDKKGTCNCSEGFLLSVGNRTVIVSFEMIKGWK